MDGWMDGISRTSSFPLQIKYADWRRLLVNTQNGHQQVFLDRLFLDEKTFTTL